MSQGYPPGCASSRPAGRRKVFGVGWAKTGTTTLGRCLQILGYDHQSQNLSLVDGLIRGDYTKVMRIAAAKESFEDWPWIVLFRELDAAFPGSRFILTTRDPVHWLDSYRAMLAAEEPPPETVTRARSYLYGFDVRTAADDDLRRRFARHNAEVCAHFRSRPGSLLVVDWEQGHGWRELCDFLDLPAPAIDFPHLNPRAGAGTSAAGDDHGIAPELPALPHDR